MTSRLSLALVIGLLAALCAVPLIAKVFGFAFLMTLFTRIVILAIAAVSLNFILGYGGMISLGHAVYIGIGGYTVGILAYHGIHSAFVQWPLALLLCALFAFITGLLSLRTRGVYFLMITLAFAQMIYFLTVGLEKYGGDDGLTIHQRSTVGGLLNLSDKETFYYVCLACLVLCVILAWRMSLSHFGMVVRGSRSNDRRMQALGLPTYWYRLVAFVVAGVMCGLAGVLLANHTDFISPEMLSWTRSGDLIIMVVVGGVGTVLGPVIGTTAYLVLEQAMSGISEHWQIGFGLLLVLMSIFRRGGIAALLSGLRR